MIRALIHALRPTRLRAVLAALLVVLVGTACNSTDVTDPTSVEPAPSSTTDAASRHRHSRTDPRQPHFSGIPYGPTSLLGQ